MSLMDRMMSWYVSRLSAEEKTKMMVKTMPLMFENMKGETIIELMGKTMPAVMRDAMCDMESGEVVKMLQEMMPRMMRNCFTRMNSEDRRKVLAMCREELAKIEEEFI